MAESCDVYWGSHGCGLPRGHDGTCVCTSCTSDPDYDPTDEAWVAVAPYYGPDTAFYGEDVRARGLPHIDDREPQA